MFIDRKNELSILNEEYKKKRASFTVIYGRRRVGKTTLISQYIKDKSSIFYYATESSLENQLQQFSYQILSFLGKQYLKHHSFDSFEQAFMFLVDHIGKEKVVIVIDEYHKLTQLDKSFSGFMQKIWDTVLSQSRIHLILCGSVITIMHNEVLSYKSPLYGRRTSNIHLKPLRFNHISQFVKGVSKLNQMNIYASFGTVPKYLELYDSRRSFWYNIASQILDKNSYLYPEVKFLLKDEISQPVTYFTILEIISRGETKIGKIGGKLGVPASHLSRYMQRLCDLDILEKQVPITEKWPEKSKHGQYRIKDNFIKFWMHYVFMNQSYLEIGNVDYVLEQIKKSFNQTFVSFAFEDYAKEQILENPEVYLGFTPTKIGRWWNNHEEIDLIAIGEEKAAFIECKWQTRKTEYSVFSELLRKSKLVNLNPNLEKVMVIFSKSGFSNGMNNLKGRFFSY
ncbi:ATP-binding protein [bacterium]|nr:ATP-binding protein [bacterium]